MSTAAPTHDKQSMQSNMRVVMLCAGIVAAMTGLAYAAVPLYDLFCRVTGYGGTTQRVENTEGVPIIDRTINVRFDANTASSLYWEFGPEKRQVELRMGEKMVINYHAKNLSDEPIVGMASFNVTPQAAGIFFNKIECFCFTDTYVEPGETLEMPVVFYVDPDMDKEKALKALNTITLSYTFFESDTSPEEIAAERLANEAGENQKGNL
ncbi:MAG: cytochrome c oxidase assembly protein [Pseudomonadota bacterium]